MAQEFEYKVVPAPVKGQKGKGVRGRDAKFANALSQVMNELGAEGWEYVRADTLPCEERTGIASKTTHYLNMLVFRRALAQVNETAPSVAPEAAAALVAQAEVLRPLLISPTGQLTPKSEWTGFEDIEDAAPAEDAELDGVIDLLAERRSRNTPEAEAADPQKTAAE